MTDARRLIQVMQQAGKTPESDLTDVVMGVVESLDPLVVLIDKLRLTSTFLVVPSAMVIGEMGNRLRLLRCGHGQKYLVLENLDVEPIDISSKQNIVISGLSSNTVEGELSHLENSLYSKADAALIGVNSGIAQLDSAGHVPASQLPSFVNDVLEYANLSSLPSTGESGIIYVTLDTNKTYRWTGTVYIEISKSLAIGETADSAFAGDRGKALETAVSAFIDIAHPIHSLYWSEVSTDPSTLFPGTTWTRVKDRFILAAGDVYTAGATGGSATHTLATTEMPSHAHSLSVSGIFNAANVGKGGYFSGSNEYRLVGGNSIDSSGSPAVLGSSNVSSLGIAVASNGSGGAHNNMPPYEVWYCWKRTA